MRSLPIVAASAMLAFLLTGSLALRADTPLQYGLQVGLALPASSDLKATVGSGPNVSLGAHLAWARTEDQTLRARLDMQGFAQGNQAGDSAGLHQEMTTKVRNASLGLEYLVRQNRWSLGAGLYLIRWTVDSSNTLTAPDGQFAPSGSSTWIREGLGLISTYRLTKQADIELHLIASHFGQENLPTRMASFNLLWHF